MRKQHLDRHVYLSGDADHAAVISCATHVALMAGCQGDGYWWAITQGCIIVSPPPCEREDRPNWKLATVRPTGELQRGEALWERV